MKRMKYRFCSVLMCICLLGISLIPGTVGQAARRPTKLIMNTRTVLVKKGGKRKLKVTGVKPKGASKAVKYQVANRKIAKISRGGVIRGRRIGVTSVRVTSKRNKHLHVLIKVVVARIVPKKVTLSDNAMTIKVGEEKKLSVSIKPAKVPKKNRQGVWESSNRKVITVNQKGECTGRSTGKAKITFTAYNGKKDSCAVSVIWPVEPEPVHEDVVIPPVPDQTTEPAVTSEPVIIEEPGTEPEPSDTPEPVPTTGGAITTGPSITTGSAITTGPSITTGSAIATGPSITTGSAIVTGPSLIYRKRVILAGVRMLVHSQY